jgi:chorismate synthase
MPIRILTAGESHGKELIGIIDGIPSGLELIASRDIDPILAERQKGYGRSYRQKIESDKAEIISGVRFGITTGAPISIRIENKDWANWQHKMSVEPANVEYDRVTIPRPGHADLAGAIKYDHKSDLRNILERASARETAMRVALGAICSKLLSQMTISSIAYVTRIGQVHYSGSSADKKTIIASSVRIPDADLTTQAEALIDEAKRRGDTLGGAVQVEFTGLPIGVGSHVQFDRKLDGRIAQAVMSIQAVKAVEIGDGVAVASTPGSASHDELTPDGSGFSRSSNHAGGIEGGMSNGMPIVVRASMKSISTLMQPLRSIDLQSGEPASAHIERSDVCAVPALSVIVEQVVATELASAIIDTFGGDTMNELVERVERRRKQALIS